jgi:hypothetical protein
MSELQPSPWGNPDRYYAASTEESLRTLDNAGQDAGRRWGRTLEQASPGIRSAVERTYKQWNNILRDYLRAETGLRLTVGGNSQSVPVKVDAGMPPRFVDVMRQFEGIEWLLLNRPAIAEAASGTGFMETHADSARLAWGDEAGPADVDDIRRVRETAANWLRKLDEEKVLSKIIGIDEDVLLQCRLRYLPSPTR